MQTFDTILMFANYSGVTKYRHMALLRLINMESGTWDQKVSFKVNEKEIVILLGRNGAGKTTLLNTIAGLLPLKSGKIIYDGIDFEYQNEVEWIEAGIRIALEGRQLFSRLSVKKNLLLGAYTQKDKTKLISNLNWVLEIFPDLKEKLNEQAVSLSGGQQTQLSVGRALMGNPKLMLLDEPTLGLDPQNIKKLIHALNIIREKHGVTIIIAEQGANLAKVFPERILILVGGEILFDGNWQEAEKEGKLANILP